MADTRYPRTRTRLQPISDEMRKFHQEHPTCSRGWDWPTYVIEQQAARGARWVRQGLVWGDGDPGDRTWSASRDNALRTTPRKATRRAAVAALLAGETWK